MTGIFPTNGGHRRAGQASPLYDERRFVDPYLYVRPSIGLVHYLLHPVDKFRKFPVDELEVTGKNGLYETRPRTEAERRAAKKYTWINRGCASIDDIKHAEAEYGSSPVSRQLKADIAAKQVRFASLTGMVRAARFVGRIFRRHAPGPGVDRVAKKDDG